MLKYNELIDQTFDFPTAEFNVVDNNLQFCGVPLVEIIDKYKTPLKLTYLPRVSEKIQMAKKLFKKNLRKQGYNGSYYYCYCTKSNHYQFVLEEVLKNNVQLETSSATDLLIIRNLYQKGLLNKEIIIVCNGHKPIEYLQGICDLVNDGFVNCIPVIDTTDEFNYYEANIQMPCKLGIRVASDEEPHSSYYTSRLGVRYNEIMNFYQHKLKNNTTFELRLLHYFVDTGIRDTAFYWNELAKFLDKYTELRKVCPTVNAIDIGGGLPIKNSLNFSFDYDYIINQIIEVIKVLCDEANVPHPDIYSEFGSFTVGESGAVLYSVMDVKAQNDKELWYMIDGSFINDLPDTWALDQKFILLAINHWNKRYQRVNLGGLTCDQMDYYSSEAHRSEVFLPRVTNGQPQYIGFFHTGAYQDALSGVGGLQHCLIPTPKHIILNRDSVGNLTHRIYRNEQDPESMLKLLGYI